MIVEMDIRKAIYNLMSTKWDRKDYRYYLREVHESYRMPCFFILADLEDETPSGVATVKKSYQVKIQYYEEGHAETKTAEIVDGFRELLLSTRKRYFILPVKDRFLEVKNFSYDYVSSDLDTPEITFRLEFFDSYATPQTGSAMEDIHIKETVKASN